MKTWTRRILLALATLAALAAGIVLVGLHLADRKRLRTIDVAVQAVPLPTTPAALDRGRYLYASRGCADCHGRDGAGRVFATGQGLRLAGPDITPAGAVARYGPEDWVRTLRHGVKPDRHPVRVMPTEDYARLTDADLGALVAYVRTLAPARGDAAVIELPLPARLAYAFGALKDGPEKVDHTLPPEAPVPEGVTVEHGRYVAQMCKGCHGPALTGGRIPGAPPDWPAAARIVPGPGSTLARYPDATAFARMLHSGRRPDGSPIAVMPFEALRELNDTDVGALWLYLTSAPGSGA